MKNGNNKSERAVLISCIHKKQRFQPYIDQLILYVILIFNKYVYL